MALAITREQAAAELNCSVRTIDRLRERGELDWFELDEGGGIRILWDSLLAFVDRRKNARRQAEAAEEARDDGLDLYNLRALVGAGRKSGEKGRA